MFSNLIQFKKLIKFHCLLQRKQFVTHRAKQGLKEKRISCFCILSEQTFDPNEVFLNNTVELQQDITLFTRDKDVFGFFYSLFAVGGTPQILVECAISANQNVKLKVRVFVASMNKPNYPFAIGGFPSSYQVCGNEVSQ